MGKKRPSEKQLTAVALIAKGVPPTKAMLKAGYSKQTARNPGKNLLRSDTITSISEQMKLRLESKGVTPIFLADQLAKFAQSENAKIFYGAYDRLSKIVGIEPNAQKAEETIKRQFTFTEWVNTIPDPNKPKDPTMEGEVIDPIETPAESQSKNGPLIDEDNSLSDLL